jgi:hypothetical protein
MKFSSADTIAKSGADGIAKHLRDTNVRFQRRTIERIVAWSTIAAEASQLAPTHTRQWRQLNEVRQLLGRQVVAAEQEMASFLAKTPYILLLSVTGGDRH